MKLSEKQKEVIISMRNGYTVLWTKGYGYILRKENGARHSRHAKPINNLIKLNLIELIPDNENVLNYKLTSLGHTIEL